MLNCQNKTTSTRYSNISGSTVGSVHLPKCCFLCSEPPDNVSVRIPDLMLDGVDYQLTCDITSVAPVQNLRVTWFYGIETLETQTFNKTATAPVNVSSVMNVTAKAGHNGGFFRCEAQLDLGPNGPKPLPRVTGEAAAVVHCEFSTLVCRGRISRRQSCSF